MITLKSQSIPVTNYTDVFDEDTVAKSITYRKAKFDEGVNAVQSKINQTNALPTLSSEDAEYLNSKINNFSNTLNDNQGIDFSNSMNLSKIDGSLNDISSDPRIQNAVASSMNHKKEMKFVEDAKNNPKKYGDVLSPYNDRDYSDNLREYQTKRANGEDAVFSYQYKPFVDIQGELFKRVEKLKASSTSIVNGNYIINGKSLTPEKIRAEALSQLETSPKLMQQLSINSRYDTEGFSDDYLLQQKNTLLQIQETKAKRTAHSELARLMSLDLKNPEHTATNISNAKLAFKNHEEALTKYQQFPKYVGSGQYNRRVLAEEITKNNILEGLDQYSYSEQSIKPNLVPLQLGKLAFEQAKFKVESNLKERMFKEQQDQNRIENDYNRLKLANDSEEGSGKKTKISGDELDRDVSRGIPDITAIDKPMEVFETQRNNSIIETRNLLVDFFKTKIGALGKIDDEFLKRYVGTAISANGKPGQFKLDKTTAELKKRFIQYGGSKIPEDAAIKTVLIAINKMSLDVNKVYETGEILSPDNSGFLSNYLKHVQKNIVMNDMPRQALNKALSENGVSETEYEYLRKKQYGTVKDANRNSIYNSEQYNKEKAVYDKIEASKTKFFTDKQAISKLYPVQTYTDKYRKESGVDIDINAVLQQGRNSANGEMNIGGTVYGVPTVWSSGAGKRVEALQYNYSTQKLSTRVYGLDGNGKEVELPGNHVFDIPRAYMEKHVSPSVKKGSVDLTQSELLHMTGEDGIYTRTSKGDYKKVFGKLNNGMGTPFRAELVNRDDVNSNQVNIFLKIPVKGVPTVVQLKEQFSSVEHAEAQLNEFTISAYKELEKQGIPKQKIPLMVAQTILNSLK